MVAELVYRYLANVAKKKLRRRRRIDPLRKVRRSKRTKSNDGRIDVMERKYSVPRLFECASESAASTSTGAADYARAVSEGRKRAKKYVCKAVSCGLYSGYLVPTDYKGKVLRVSPNLKLFKTGKRTQGIKRNANDSHSDTVMSKKRKLVAKTSNKKRHSKRNEESANF